jgi:hypothetical protein
MIVYRPPEIGGQQEIARNLLQPGPEEFAHLLDPVHEARIHVNLPDIESRVPSATLGIPIEFQGKLGVWAKLFANLETKRRKKPAQGDVVLQVAMDFRDIRNMHNLRESSEDRLA